MAGANIYKTKRRRERWLSKSSRSLSTACGASYARVSIKDQKTCWEVVRGKGNLNFNYKLLFLPEHLQDYVIVHELAHLSELSHSPRFWALVGTVIPDYAARRRELRAMRLL